MTAPKKPAAPPDLFAAPVKPKPKPKPKLPTAEKIAQHAGTSIGMAQLILDAIEELTE